eukprot:6195874-Pleurochrysis_carterae.AAC.1
MAHTNRLCLVLHSKAWPNCSRVISVHHVRLQHKSCLILVINDSTSFHSSGGSACYKLIASKTHKLDQSICKALSSMSPAAARAG